MGRHRRRPRTRHAAEVRAAAAAAAEASRCRGAGRRGRRRLVVVEGRERRGPRWLRPTLAGTSRRRPSRAGDVVGRAAASCGGPPRNSRRRRRALEKTMRRRRAAARRVPQGRFPRSLDLTTFLDASSPSATACGTARATSSLSSLRTRGSAAPAGRRFGCHWWSWVATEAGVRSSMPSSRCETHGVPAAGGGVVQRAMGRAVQIRRRRRVAPKRDALFVGGDRKVLMVIGDFRPLRGGVVGDDESHRRGATCMTS